MLAQKGVTQWKQYKIEGQNTTIKSTGPRHVVIPTWQMVVINQIYPFIWQPFYTALFQPSLILRHPLIVLFKKNLKILVRVYFCVCNLLFCIVITINLCYVISFSNIDAWNISGSPDARLARRPCLECEMIKQVKM